MEAKFSEETALRTRFASENTMNAEFHGIDVLRSELSGNGEMDAQFIEAARATGQKLLVATTAEWNAQRSLIAEKGCVYVYSDYEHTELGTPVPGFKVGDGLAYLIDLPFNDDLFLAHASDNVIHVTDAEREFWNNKVTAYINATNTEELVLTKN